MYQGIQCGTAQTSGWLLSSYYPPEKRGPLCTFQWSPPCVTAVREVCVPMPFDRRHANTTAEKCASWTAHTECAVCGVPCVTAVREVRVPMPFDRRHAYTVADKWASWTAQTERAICGFGSGGISQPVQRPRVLWNPPPHCPGEARRPRSSTISLHSMAIVTTYPAIQVAT